MNDLVGGGDTVALFALPFVLVGAALNYAFPSAFEVGGPQPALEVASIIVLIPGVTIWIWSVASTGVALFVLPWAGFLLHTWVGALIGVGLYLGSRRSAPEEEAELGNTFGAAWDDSCGKVKVPWL